VHLEREIEMAVVLCIDAGSTNLKAGLIDKTGTILAVARRALTPERPEPGAAEFDANQIWKALMECCKEVTAGRQKQIRMISVSTYHYGLLFLDKDGEPISKLSNLLDTRAQKTFSDFKKEYDVHHLYKTTGCPPYTQNVLPRLFYFSRTQPDLIKKAGMLASSKAWIMYKLTGQLASDPGVESGSQMMNISTRQWDSDILNSIGLSEEKMPKIYDALETVLPIKSEVASALGLSSDVGVIPGIYDGAAVALGLGVFEEGDCFSNIGTTAPLRVSSIGAKFDDPSKMRFQPNYFMQGRYLVGNAINNGSLPLRWLKENVLDLDYEELDRIAGEAPIGSNGLFTLPYLSGDRDVNFGTVASGVFFGLKDWHTRNEMVRAILEGVAYTMNVIKSGLEESDIKVGSIKIGGGGVRSAPIWLNILANVFNRTLLATPDREACLMGNAILAFTARGHFADVTEAIKSLVIEPETIQSDSKQVQQYQKYFHFYQQLCKDITPIFFSHSKFCDEIGASLKTEQ
jgi:gluconokinase